MTAPAASRGEWLPDPCDAQRVLRAPELLRAFNEAGVLAAADVHVATALARLGGELDDNVVLAAAMAVRGVRLGSVCVDLGTVAESVVVDELSTTEIAALPWPAPDDWLTVCRASRLVAVGDAPASASPLRLQGQLIYLDRYWRQEEQIRRDLSSREVQPPPDVDAHRLRGGLARLFPPGDPDPAQQRVAAAVCATRWVTVLAGGPGTGKTTTIARLLALLLDLGGPAPRIALAAPTGKAAARLEEAVREVAGTLPRSDADRLAALTASTLHRLLGRRPDSHTRFRHDRTHRLPFDVVVVDETSMVSLTMMARLLEALRPDARLVLVGDPEQLTSVEAGAVLGDLVHRPAEHRAPPACLTAVLPDALVEAAEGPAAEAGVSEGVVRLSHTWRYGGAIAELATAVRRGDADGVLEVLRSGSVDVTFTELSDVPRESALLRADVTAPAAILTAAARVGDIDGALAGLRLHRLLCAHREGPFGVARWSEQIERWLASAISGYAADGEWYAGRPLLVTANDYAIPLYNGDTGVVVNVADGEPQAAFERAGGPVLISPGRLAAVATVHAMTVHKSQGSQFARVSVLLPPAESTLLTRELLYTAVTRAERHVHVLATEQAVRVAVGRPVARASGLRRRLDAPN